MLIQIAGRELFDYSTECEMKSGSLWVDARKMMEPKPSSSAYSAERWSFWRQRLLELADLDVLGPELTAVCDEAAMHIAGLLEEAAHL
jgi:hypothetical protein